MALALKFQFASVLELLRGATEDAIFVKLPLSVKKWPCVVDLQCRVHMGETVYKLGSLSTVLFGRSYISRHPLFDFDSFLVVQEVAPVSVLWLDQYRCGQRQRLARPAQQFETGLLD